MERRKIAQDEILGTFWSLEIKKSTRQSRVQSQLSTPHLLTGNSETQHTSAQIPVTSGYPVTRPLHTIRRISKESCLDRQQLLASSGAIMVRSGGTRVKLLFAFLLLAGSAALAQNQKPLTGCPLRLEGASVTSLQAAYMPAGSAQVNRPALDLRFRNQSGKPITSASFTARLFGKRSIYQLDASEFDLPITVTSVNANTAKEHKRSIRFPDQMQLYGVAALVTLDRVAFADGSEWIAPRDNACRAGAQPGPQQIAK
jgi:hypothetical protein